MLRFSKCSDQDMAFSLLYELTDNYFREYPKIM
jgi:hypothetical protein